jgi:glyoxylase-like metal-dependent hydrolase (beta-lactamase superfamily II)
MREIVTGVFTWPWFSAPHGYNFNGFLILDQGGNICIDPVEPDADTLAELTRRGAARIILTNRNHVRAANRVRGATGARTAIHPDDAGYARSQGAELDDELRAGQKVGPLGVVAVPGKSPGEVALHLDRR